MDNIIPPISSNMAYLQKIVHQLPAFIYINQVDLPDDISTAHIIWMNQRGHDYIKYTREEIEEAGYDFLKKIIHPDDFSVAPQSYNWGYSKTDEFYFAHMHRIKPKNGDYCWFYAQTVILDYHTNGSPKTFLNVAFEIVEVMHTDKQLFAVMKEVARLKNELKLSAFTRREKEIMQRIVQGKTDKEIAAELFISFTTARKHRNNIIRKAGVKNSSELAAMLAEIGFGSTVRQ